LYFINLPLMLSKILFWNYISTIQYAIITVLSSQIRLMMKTYKGTASLNTSII